MAEPAPIFELDAGRLCLDFANTVKARPLSDRIENIHKFEDLLEWSRQATILTPGEAAALTQEARRRPAEAAHALTEALGLREAIYAVFSALAAGLQAPAVDLRTINQAIGKAMSRAGVSPMGTGFEWSWPDAPMDLDRVAWWVARSVGELLTSGDLTFVRECAGYDCGRLFMDTTKNRSRRWCDMSICGNRAKGRRHYERTRSRQVAG